MVIYCHVLDGYYMVQLRGFILMNLSLYTFLNPRKQIMLKIILYNDQVSSGLDRQPLIQAARPPPSY